MASPRISIIIPTYNSALFLVACLESVKKQTSSDYELIVVDNHSQDTTREIAHKYTDNVYTKGPERCAQRNYGASKAQGTHLLFIDSDMELAPDLIEECAKAIKSHEDCLGLVVPEQSFGKGFWAQCKRLEKEFYIGVASIEAARCFTIQAFNEVGGYDEDLVSGEDWDLASRVGQKGKIGRVASYVFHNEGQLSLWRTVKKKFYYARHYRKYLQKRHSGTQSHGGVFRQFALFFSQPQKIVKQPIVWLGLIFMKLCEFGFGGLGLIWSRIQRS